MSGSFVGRCGVVSPTSGLASSTPSARRRRTPPWRHAQDRINEWCWPSTSASPSPTSGRTRNTSPAGVGCTGRSASSSGGPYQRSTASCSSRRGRGPPCTQWMPEAARVPGVVIPNFVRAVPEHAVARRGDLVSVGNLEAIKNHRYLLRVLAVARQRGFRYTLDVFGEGVERGNLLALAAELGIDDQVRLRGFRRDVPRVLPGYRLYVHASYSESLPLAIMEAMGAGLPVVSSDAGGVPELFDDPEQGRFWPHRRPTAGGRDPDRPPRVRAGGPESRTSRAREVPERLRR